jgi:predicted HD phosphohydrolase
VALTLPGIRSLFDRSGGRMYAGEPVTQLEHALQTAHSAELAGADAALVTAALLHDLGHLLNDQGETPTARGIDDVHQYAALPFLRPLFDDEVLEPIRLHVDAKRYLCAASRLLRCFRRIRNAAWSCKAAPTTKRPPPRSLHNPERCAR